MSDQFKLISAQHLYKSYPQGAGRLEILKDLSFEIDSGEAVCIVGASGSGKSTLLHILGTLDNPDSGQLSFLGKSLIEMKDEELARFRNREMGFVFQFHHLLSEFNALENVMLPARVAKLGLEEAESRAVALLKMMGMGERLRHYANQLSGGELQRVAIARALICRPRILFADEPTGNLDSVNSGAIQDLFFELKETLGLSLVVVTHDPLFARKFGKVQKMSDGRWV